MTDLLINESKQVLDILKAEVENFNAKTGAKFSLSSAIRIFSNSAADKDNINYCIACVLTHFINPYKFSSKSNISKGIFTVNTSIDVDVNILGELDNKYKFKNKATELLIENPNFKRKNLEKYL